MSTENLITIPLNHLIKGGFVLYKGLKIRMTEDNNLVSEALEMTTGDTIYLNLDWSFKDFMDMCTDLPKEENIRLSSAEAIKKHHEKGAIK